MAKYKIKDGVGIISEGTKVIKDYAFCGRKSLTKIVIPVSVKKFGDDVFDECTNLEAINVPAKKINYYKKHLPEELHSLIKPIN